MQGQPLTCSLTKGILPKQAAGVVSCKYVSVLLGTLEHSHQIEIIPPNVVDSCPGPSFPQLPHACGEDWSVGFSGLCRFFLLIRTQ